jgi:hypothetical protein
MVCLMLNKSSLFCFVLLCFIGGGGGLGGPEVHNTRTKVVAILPLSDSSSALTCLRVCLHQMKAQLVGGNEQIDRGLLTSSSDNTATSLYHAYDAVDKTLFTFMLAPCGMRRDLFFALEAAKAADIIMFAVNSAGNKSVPSSAEVMEDDLNDDDDAEAGGKIIDEVEGALFNIA